MTAYLLVVAVLTRVLHRFRDANIWFVMHVNNKITLHQINRQMAYEPLPETAV